MRLREKSGSIDPKVGVLGGWSAIGKLRGLPFVAIAIALTDYFPALFGS